MDKYKTFIDSFLNELENSMFMNNIYSVYIGGSVSRGDYVIGISDIDLYIVSKIKDSNMEKGINDISIRIANNYLYELLSWCPDGVTIAFTTLDEVNAGNSWLGYGAEYYSFIDTGKLLLGNDIKNILNPPTKQVIKQNSLDGLKALGDIVSKDITGIEFDRYFIRGLFGAIFSATHFELSYKGIYLRGKKQMVDKFCELYSGELKSF